MVPVQSETPAVRPEECGIPLHYTREEQEKILQAVQEVTDRKQRRTCSPPPPMQPARSDLFQPLLISGAAALLIAAASILIPRIFPPESAEPFRIGASSFSAESTLLAAYRESSRRTLEGKEHEIRRIRESIARVRSGSGEAAVPLHGDAASAEELTRYRDALSKLEHEREILVSMLQDVRTDEPEAMAVGMQKSNAAPAAEISRTEIARAEDSASGDRAALADAAESFRLLESENASLRRELTRKQQELEAAVVRSSAADQTKSDRRSADLTIERLRSLLGNAGTQAGPAVLPSKELYLLLESKIRIKEILDSPDIKGRYPDLYDQMERYNLALREEEKTKSVTRTIDDLVILTETVRSAKDPSSAERIVSRYGMEGYAGRMNAFLAALAE